MSLQDDAVDDKAGRLLAVAREIIRENGNFDLPMRKLAARGKVSLRAPYDIFGSKSGVIRAILKADQAEFSRLIGDPLPDLIDDLYRRIHIAIQFYAAEQPFYRALFRAAHAFWARGEPDDPEDMLRVHLGFAKAARTRRLLSEDVDAILLGEALNDVFYGNLESWANGQLDFALVEAKIGFGYAALLLATLRKPHARRMRRRMLECQAQVQNIVGSGRVIGGR